MNAQASSAAQLDALAFPLTGSRLIEASAGTGKTFTIATLYVRLVLGHGGIDAFSRVLTPPEILVVTFTDAAVQELRDRIRRRLAEAATYFRCDPADIVDRPRGEDVLHDLLADYLPNDWPLCARRLQLAAEWMDEAAVSTIHSWCQRMLREHAFDSGSLFTQRLEADQSELLAEVVRDYWRTFLVPLDGEAVAEVRRWFSGPETLREQLQKLIPYVELLQPAEAPAVLLKATREDRQARLAELKAPWAVWADELQTLLDEAIAQKRVNGRKLQARFYNPWVEALRLWANEPNLILPDLKTGWSRLTPTGLQEVWTVGEPPVHPALVALAELGEQLGQLPDPRPGVLSHAARWTSERFAQEQARQAQMGFQELLTRLDGALQGIHGDRLAETIRQQFPVALIDEFQDTDPVQYRIFDAVYRVADAQSSTTLILIGDPKQAIYAFRGADIYTYLTARRDCGDRLYTLKRNFRSTHGAVKAVNRCFEIAEKREGGSGAFLFRQPADNPVPFVPALAHGRSDELLVEGKAVPALTIRCAAADDEGKPLPKGVYFETMAAAFASEMVQLLNQGCNGLAVFRDGEAERPLQPGDFAVLVNSRREADAIRTALAQRAVRSVYLSDHDSVFAGAQATELRYWLEACAEPDDVSRVRAALATATLGLTWHQLDMLRHDELALEERVLQFHLYADCWRRQGVLPMIRQLLNDFEVPARLLDSSREVVGAADSGERILTDLLHLTELLQQASSLLDGPRALIRHLAEQQQDLAAAASADARQIRLESDANLVQVVTVHKAKGLEYPLVFFPFAANFRAVAPTDLPLRWHDAAGSPQISLTAEDARVVARADEERLGEDLRKLYVALTRARHATWVGLAPLKELERSAFGYLLNGGGPIGPDDLAQWLDELASGQAEISVVPVDEPSSEHFKAADVALIMGVARTSRPVVEEPWWIASYSALVSGLDHRGPTTDRAGETVAEEVFQEVPPSAVAAPLPARPLPGSWHDFPRGPEAGAFLHELLEWAAQQGFQEITADPARLRDFVARRCSQRGWAHWIEPLNEWIRCVLTTPLQLPEERGMSATAVSLASLDAVMGEMEFWFAATAVEATEIDRLITMQTLGGASRPPIQSTRLNGMLKGFIDLVFEHQGRYYVADYKSNWLGHHDAAYTPAALCSEILRARYDLQYVLYLLALHRLLRSRLPDYDYDRHVGGALYLFLRGLNAPSQGLHVERPCRELIKALDVYFAPATAGG